jgi:hypothetical protein
MKEVPLTQGFMAQVDDEDYDRIMQHKWYYHDGYAARGLSIEGKQVIQRLPNFIMQVYTGLFDHKDHNPLNNQQYNLRQCTQVQNNQNAMHPIGSSGYRGVTTNTNKRCKVKPWHARISINGRRISLGRFNNSVAAACAYDTAAKKYHGEFAVLNFPEIGETNG